MARCFLSLYCPGIENGRLRRLVEWCDRYSPLAAQDGDDGVILDITGCAHLWGGEGPLFLDVQQRLQRIGLAVQLAITDTRGAAWALARYGDRLIVHGEYMVLALVRLPVEALRIPGDTALQLRRLGLTTIADLRKIPRRSLRVRFGAPLLLRIDQVFRRTEEPLTPWRPPAPYRASRILAEPISTVGAVEYVLGELMEEICARLEKNHAGARHMDFACYRVDGSVDHSEVRTSKPTRSTRHLLRLFTERLENLRADFGFEAFVLSAPDIEGLYPAQLRLTPSEASGEEGSFDTLVDRLGMRLGFAEVSHVRVRESYLPEHAVELCPATASAGPSAEWPSYRVRPIRLIEPPMPIQVSILIPGESPVQFRIGPQPYRIVRSEGPESLAAEWWRDGGPRWKERRYYRVEDDRGLRFWIFCDPSEHWFLHGHLP